jgi:hypothetical protein
MWAFYELVTQQCLWTIYGKTQIDGQLGFAKVCMDILWTCNNFYGHFMDLQKSMWAFYGLVAQ